MDSAAGQNALSRFHPQQQVDQTSVLSPGYWSDVDTLYAAEQNHQLQRQQEQSPPQPEQPPLGIGWDHAVFQQQRPAQALQNQQQLPVTDQNGHSHAHPQGMYAPPPPPPQTWHQSPPQQQARLVSPTPQDFGQYHPSHHYPQQHLGYESRLLNPTESASFPQYAYPQSLYAAPQLTGQDTYSQPSSLQPLRRESYSSQTTPQQPQYAVSSDFPEHLRQPQLGFPSDFNGRMNSSSSQQTINPRFLDSPEQALNQQQAGFQNNQLYFGPTEFKQPDNEKLFQYYRQDGQPASALQQPMENTQFSVIIPKQAPTSVTHPINAVEAKKKKKTTAKKPTQPQTKKTTKAAKKSDGDVSDASDLEIVDPEEPSLLPAVRPTDPVAAVEYDTIKAVWSPRNRQPDVDRIKAALNPFKDIVKSIRDTWKDKTQAMQVAENQGNNDKAAALKKEVVFHRRLMDAVVTTALEKGHPRIIEHLGQAPLSVIAMYSFLLDRHQASDFDGTLTINILKLLSRLITMDEVTLQKTKVDKLLDRLIKKGGPTVKELAQKVLDNAAAATKRKQESTKGVAKAGSTVKGASPDVTAAAGDRSPLVGSKRGRDGDTNGLPATKKVVVTSSLKNGSKLSTAAHANLQRSPDPATETKTSVAAPTVPRPKANIVAPKPTSLFGTLASASKRPGTSNAERAAAAALAKASTTEKNASPAPPPPKPAFSLGDIMADLNKQTAPAPVAPVEEKAPETEEERQKRLRKEERRKLRVSWKPDGSLTEIRLFTHDPDEELGPQNGAQAGDVKGEGSVLKLHRDLDEIEDDEDAVVREESLSPYRPASAVDFMDLSADDRARNYVKRAGSQPPSSTEKDAQDRREATTLMVFYTSGEVPPSPKEPPPPTPSEAEPAVEEVPFGDIPDHVKARQERYYAFTQAKPVATPAAPPKPLTAAPGSNPIDIAGLLKIIQGVSQPQPQQNQTNPMVDLERTFNLFRQQSQPQPPSTVAQMPQVNPIPMPQAPATSGPDLQQILAAMNAQPQVQQPPVVPQVPQAQPGVAPNLAAIFSQLAQPNQQASTSQHYEDPERKRMRDLAAAGCDGPQEERWQSQRRSRPNFDKPKKPYKVGLVACRYWREGKCLKGDNCTFRHDPLDK